MYFNICTFILQNINPDLKIFDLDWKVLQPSPVSPKAILGVHKKIK